MGSSTVSSWNRLQSVRPDPDPLRQTPGATNRQGSSGGHSHLPHPPDSRARPTSSPCGQYRCFAHFQQLPQTQPMAGAKWMQKTCLATPLRRPAGQSFRARKHRLQHKQAQQSPVWCWVKISVPCLELARGWPCDLSVDFGLGVDSISAWPLVQPWAFLLPQPKLQRPATTLRLVGYDSHDAITRDVSSLSDEEVSVWFLALPLLWFRQATGRASTNTWCRMRPTLEGHHPRSAFLRWLYYTYPNIPHIKIEIIYKT